MPTPFRPLIPLLLVATACGLPPPTPVVPTQRDPLAHTRAWVGSIAADVIQIQPTTDSGSRRVARTFTFEGQVHTVTVDIPSRVLAGARIPPRVLRSYGSAALTDRTARFHVPLIVDPAQEPFFAALLGQLRALRDARGLDRDRYFELMTAFVQAIPYDYHAPAARFPIEVYADGTGDCDEKTRLLAGLAAREGYAVAILAFDDDNHVALGVRVQHRGFRGGPWAYVETTNAAWVGDPKFDTERIWSGHALHDAEVVPVGTGSTVYGADVDVARIAAAREALSRSIDAAEATLARAREELQRHAATLRSLESLTQRAADLDAERRAIQAYNEAVQANNAEVERYNAVVAKQRADVTLYNRLLRDAPSRAAVLPEVLARFPRI